MSQPLAFTHDAYRTLITTLGERNYVFSTFSQAEELLQYRRPFVLLRHDIDFDLECALKMAEIEASVSIQSTYFFMIRTEHYNVFSEAGTDLINRILALGHHLGLHFDCAAYPQNVTRQDLAKACQTEAMLLQNWFDRDVEIVSYHRPNAQVMTGDPKLSAPLPHTYMKMYTKEIQYCSDSQGVWRFGDPLSGEAYRQREPMHLLVHPIWWHDKAQTPLETLQQFCDTKSKHLTLSVAKNCKVYRMPGSREVA